MTVKEKLPGDKGWGALLKREWLMTLAILLGGVLLQSMNVLMLATVLPSIVDELGGVAMLSWPTTAFLAASIVAASCASMIASAIGRRTAYCAGVVTFGVGALVCAAAPTMGWIVAGRMIQGFGGGLEAAVAYVVVRRTFPADIWPRTLALMSSSWSVSVLLGPLIGGLFAYLGHWRSAFIATAIVAAILAASAWLFLPADREKSPLPSVPAGRIGLICAAIASLSLTSITDQPAAKIALVVVAVGLLAAMLRLNRSAATPMFPRDAFSFATPAGVGLWVAVLLCISYGPLQVYVPLFLQRLHGLGPLLAGFIVAIASLAWSGASLVTAGASGERSNRLIVVGPALMAVGQLIIALFMPGQSVFLSLPGIILLGIGIGQSWPFVAQRIMRSAHPGDEAVAAASVPTIQQMGFAFGAALAGLSASFSGLSAGATPEAIAHAAFWLPASFVIPAVLCCLASLRLGRLNRSGWTR